MTDIVFPAEEVRQLSTSNQGYKVKAGEHEYGFRFKIPVNTNCTPNQSFLSKLSFDKGTLDYAKTATKHIRTTLPPSLSGIPDDAARVWYYLKVTVVRFVNYGLQVSRLENDNRSDLTS